MLFIIIHQVYELWFKELLHEFDRVARLLTGDEPHRAQHTLKRILTILKVLVAQLDILETMTPLEFLSFRARLEAASGFQSDQFRQIEFLLGAKSETAIGEVSRGEPRARGADAPLSVRRRCGTRFSTICRAKAMRVPATQLSRDVTAATEASSEIQQILIDVYRRDPKNAELCERLVDLDEGSAGVAVSPRQNGGANHWDEARHRGSTGVPYLAGTLGRPLFPDLWEIRGHL